MQKGVVIKIGTSILTNGTGGVQSAALRHYAKECRRLITDGYAPLLVTSGAVQIGRSHYPAMQDKKTLASVGQAGLIAHYRTAFSGAGLVVAQLLCSRSDIAKPKLFAAFQHTIRMLLENGIVAIVNENDALTNGESEAFGNNDMLAAVAAVAMSAEKLLLLTDQEGFYTADPRSSQSAELIREIGDVTRELFACCSAGTSSHGVGGMIAKLKAARMAIAGGVETIIANGLGNPDMITLISGASASTRFLARRKASDITNHDRRILATQSGAGVLVIDSGAIDALRHRKSLLAVGVREVKDDFREGDIVEIMDESRHEVGSGMVGISSDSLRLLMKKRTIKDIDVIHCDHLIMY